GFDYVNVAAPLTERQTTTVAPQALMLLNDPFQQEQAAAFAERLEKDAGADPVKRIDRAYQLALGRLPTSAEQAAGVTFLNRQAAALRAQSRRLTFAADVPQSLSIAYRNHLKPTDYLLGPTDGWSYYTGRWGGAYEGIVTLDKHREPFALWRGRPAADWSVETNLTMENAAEFASLLLRATAVGDDFRGYEVCVSPRDQAVVVRRYGGKVDDLAVKPTKIAFVAPNRLKVDLVGGRLRVWWNDALTVDVVDPQPLDGVGRLGVRCWGAAASFDPLVATVDGRPLDVATAPTDPETTGLPVGWTGWGGGWSAAAGVFSSTPTTGGKVFWDGPAAPRFADGAVEAEVRLNAPQGDVGLLLRADKPNDGGDGLTAYNVNVTKDAIRLGVHRNDWRELAAAPFDFGLGKWRSVRAKIEKNRVRIYVDHSEKPVIDHTAANPPPAGRLGLRTYMASASVRGLKATTPGGTVAADFTPPPPSVPAPLKPTPERSALASFCLLLFNTNEFVYAD
ncbi:MAG: DUF1553 domain-containing protein, partial [Planctomycetia bacterium]